MSNVIVDSFSWRGTIGRSRYLITGLILVAIKHNLDRILATLYGYRWGLFNYWLFSTPSGVLSLSTEQYKFYGELISIALPFVWIGTVLTIRRLRDTSLPVWLVFLFFVPFLNLLLFIILSVLPSRQSVRGSTAGHRLKALIPSTEFGSATFGIFSTSLVAVLLTLLGTEALSNYGWGLFIGIPFCLGLNSVLIFGVHERRSFGRSLIVAGISTFLAGLLLLAFAIEGVICLAMAFPLALVLALLGGVVGYGLQKTWTAEPYKLRMVSVVLLVMPGLMILESSLANEPEVFPITTSVVINAKPESVWKHVVQFSELPTPTEALFKTGIAFPIRADISGSGVGSIRECKFSTGSFVEPITVWNEPHLLGFDVKSQPPVMEEWSLYDDLNPPHLENYLVSKRGQFELKALPDGRTLLEGTTWYQNRMWPSPYWKLWSDYIIHRIHHRVLSHIKTETENDRLVSRTP